MLVSTEGQETIIKEQLVMTLLQDNHGDLHFLVVLVQDQNQVVILVLFLVHRDVSLVLVDKEHGVMVQLQHLVVVVLVYTIMEL